MSLADYLAKNYLTAHPATDKQKKKKKRKKEKEGIIIADGDALGWDSDGDDKDKKDDNDGILVVRDGHSSDFRKTKISNWITNSGGTKDDHGAAEAAAVLAQATLEKEAQEEEDDRPTITMESGAHAGLQTAAQVSAALRKKREQDLVAFKAADPIVAGKGQETIYRDASGRIVNIAMARAEARKVAEAEAAKAAKDALRLKGDVQLLEEKEKKKELEEARFKTLARYKDDVELNDELKDRERWNDPAAAFLTKGKDGGLSKTGRKLYQGAWAPNRYGIRPGHRWDGVDRGNGFEKKWFEARGKREAIRELEYQWEMDE